MRKEENISERVSAEIVTYDAVIQAITPVKSEYAVGEMIQVKVKGYARRETTYGAWLMLGVAWHTIYKLYDEAGNLLDTSTHYHSVAPWTMVDTATDDFVMNARLATAGMAEVGEFCGKVVMTAAG